MTYETYEHRLESQGYKVEYGWGSFINISDETDPCGYEQARRKLPMGNRYTHTNLHSFAWEKKDSDDDELKYIRDNCTCRVPESSKDREDKPSWIDHAYVLKKGNKLIYHCEPYPNRCRSRFWTDMVNLQTDGWKVEIKTKDYAIWNPGETVVIWIYKKDKK